MKQSIKGKFEMVLRGIPYLFVTTSFFISERGTATKVWMLHVGPFALGLNVRR